MFFTFPILINEAEYYAPIYIQYCEYFQIDPRINYKLKQFHTRYDEILQAYQRNPGVLTSKDLRKIKTGIKWIEKHHKKLDLIVDYINHLLIKKDLIIPGGMIQDTFLTSKNLSSESLKPYNKQQAIIIGIFSLTLAVFFIIFFSLL